MAVRSMGVKVLAISSRIGSTDTYDDAGGGSNHSNSSSNLKKHASSNSVRRKKRPRARTQHFRPRIPEHYICPITQELMTEPVILSSSGHTFEKRAIAQWLEDGNTINPMTGEHLNCIDIKPNYALSDALKEFRRKLASELFRITFDEDEQEERLCYRNNVLFAAEKDSSSSSSSEEDDEKRMPDEHINEHDGYITDDEQELNDCTHHPSDKKRRRGGSYYIASHKHKRGQQRNIPILAFMGPNNIGKSTLLNLIVGEPVFVTMDELSDYDSLCKAVRFKVVNRAHRQFILLDVEGLFPHSTHTQEVDEAVMKIFYAVYAISSVIIWNDTNEQNPLLQTLLRRADTMMHDINGEADQVFQQFTEHIHDTFAETADGSLLPEPLRQFLLKKYRKLCKNKNNTERSLLTHKPAFVFLRRDFVSHPRKPRSMITNDVSQSLTSDTEHTSPWLSSDSDFPSSKCSPSTLCLSSDSTVPLNDAVARWTLNGNDSAAETAAQQPTAVSAVLSMVDELKEEKDAIHAHIMSDSSAAAAAMPEVPFGDGTPQPPPLQYRQRRRSQRKSHSMQFGEYVRTHAQFAWLRRLRLFSSVDGVVLPKLQPVLCDSDCDDIDMDSDCDGVDESMLHVLPKLDNWINTWCRSTQHIVPLVRSHDDMLRVVYHINRYNMLSSVKYVEDCLQVRGSRLPRYFYYDAKERTLHEMKLIAERFHWDNKQLLAWFEKHFNRLWYFVRHFPNAHHALLYQALCCQQYLALHALDDDEDPDAPPPMIPTIVMNLCHFYYQISNKVDLYGDIVSKSISIGKFAGASLSGLGSLSLMSVIHPILGFAAVPLSIRIGSSLGANSGAKVGDAIANSKAHFVDGTERYDLGKEYHE